MNLKKCAIIVMDKLSANNRMYNNFDVVDNNGDSSKSFARFIQGVPIFVCRKFGGEL
jgi:hypothetical protein